MLISKNLKYQILNNTGYQERVLAEIEQPEKPSDP